MPAFPDTFTINSDEAAKVLLELTDRLSARRVGVALITPAFVAMARVVIARAKTRNFGFRDRTGLLRDSIRVRKLRRVRRESVGGSTMEISVEATSGGPGARQAYLVERGHGGPHPAGPHSYMRRALREKAEEGYTTWAEVARRRAQRLMKSNRRI